MRKPRLLGIICVIALLGIMFPSSTFAQAKSRLVIENPVYDFGQVQEGAKVTHNFVLKNEGDAELDLLRVVPGCGCTITNLEKKKLLPGEEANLGVEFDTEGFSGEKSKSIRLYSSDADSAVSVLTLKGIIEPEILVEPKRVFFGNLFPDGRDQSVEVRVQIREESPLELVSIKNYSKFLSVEEIERSAKSARFLLRVDEEAAAGDLRDRVILNLKGGSPRSVNVPVFASIKGPVKIQPSTLSFGIMDGEAPLERTIRIDTSSGQPLELGDVKSEDDAVSVEVETLSSGRSYLLRVQVDPSKVEKVLRSVIRVETSSDKQPELSISVYGIKPPDPA